MPRPVQKSDGLKRKRWRPAEERLGTGGADERKGERSWFVPLVVGWWWGSGLPLGSNYRSDSVRVNDVGAEMHQLVDSLSVDLFQFTGADVLAGAFSKLDELSCAVGCVGDPLVAGGGNSTRPGSFTAKRSL